MIDVKPLVQKAGVFPALGAVLLAVGLLLAKFTDGHSVLVFVVLSASVALFALASALIGYKIYGPDKVVASPAVPAAPHPDTKTVAAPPLPVASQPSVRIVPLPDIKMVPPPQAKALPPQDIKSAPPPQTAPDIAKLMNTTLGDILLAAYLKDPEEAGRIVVQAIVEAEGGLSPSKVQASV